MLFKLSVRLIVLVMEDWGACLPVVHPEYQTADNMREAKVDRVHYST